MFKGIIIIIELSRDVTKEDLKNYYSSRFYMNLDKIGVLILAFYPYYIALFIITIFFIFGLSSINETKSMHVENEGVSSLES